MASYFAIFLVCLSFGSGLIWLYDAKVLAPKRREKLATAEAELGDKLDEQTASKIMQQPVLAETAQSIFPVVVIITVFRSFFFEPFQIPSGSMKPNLLVGDFILVKKFAYGVKDPVTRTKFIETGKPERGDVAVFKYPLDEKIDFIKRIVGLPGDRILYTDRKLYIKPSCDTSPDNCDKYTLVGSTVINDTDFATLRGRPMLKMEADMFGLKHEYLINPDAPIMEGAYHRQNGTQMNEWVVPEGQYFALGDNRDNSEDSRYWGFVPEENFVGKAVFIWMSFEFGRSPDDWIPTFVPTDVRFERLGSF